MHNIPELPMTRKTKDIVLVLTIALLGIVSFGLGRLSAETNTEKVPVTLCESIIQPETQQNEASAATSLTSPGATMQYVASKNGTVYHLPWCSGAKRISKENMVWFSTKTEAEKAGYRPAANCKGI
jgi:hypothetical protein